MIHTAGGVFVSEKRSSPVSKAMSLDMGESSLCTLYCHLIDVGWVSHELLNVLPLNRLCPYLLAQVE